MVMPSVLYFRNCSTFQKNKSGRIIILYDEDERIAPDVATKFVQKDVDNVFVLSGGDVDDTSTFVLHCCIGHVRVTLSAPVGLRILYKVFPTGLMTGTVPLSCLPTPPPSVAGKRRPSNSRKSVPVTLPAREWFTEQGIK